MRDEVEHRSLDGRIEAGRGFIEDQQRRVLRQRHRDHHALLHPARKLVRIARHHPRRSRDLHPREHRVGLGPRRRMRAAEQLVGFRDLPPDRQRRVQRATRILIDHRERARPQPAQCRGIKLGQHLAADHDAARAHAPIAQQPRRSRPGRRSICRSRFLRPARTLRRDAPRTTRHAAPEDHGRARDRRSPRPPAAARRCSWRGTNSSTARPPPNLGPLRGPGPQGWGFTHFCRVSGSKPSPPLGAERVG